jgi:hypothetical protein
VALFCTAPNWAEFWATQGNVYGLVGAIVGGVVGVGLSSYFKANEPINTYIVAPSTLAGITLGLLAKIVWESLC